MKPVYVPDQLPYLTFIHTDGQQWALHPQLMADEPDKLYSIQFGKVIPTAKGYEVDAVISKTARQSTVDYAGGMVKFMKEKAIPHFNQFLAAASDVPEIPNFPEEGSHVEQLNWIIENALEYVNGQIVVNGL